MEGKSNNVALRQQLHNLGLTEVKATKLWMVIKRRRFKGETPRGMENVKLRLEKADITRNKADS